MKWYFFSLAMLLAAVSGFTQEVEISSSGYGLETSFGVISGNELPNNYSVSFQEVFDWGAALSVDWIQGKPPEGSGFLAGTGFLGSAFWGFPIGNVFRPYVGGGLGFRFNGKVIDFAWKADAGVVAWLSDLLYIKAGVMYDNVREDLGISIGIGFKLHKDVTDTYRGYNGSTFRRTFTKNLWNDNSTPNRVYADKFEYSEVVRRYQKTTTDSSYTRAQYEVRTSGGETSTTTLQDQSGKTIATATTTTPTKTDFVKTEDAKITTYYYVYNVTVTRNWYTRTWYYKDREPTTERVYQDTESAVLVNKFSETERR